MARVLLNVAVMNIGLALTATPPTHFEPVPPELADDNGLFAALFGQKFASADAATGHSISPPNVPPNVLIAPAGAIDAAFRAAAAPAANAAPETEVALPALVAVQPPVPQTSPAIPAPVKLPAKPKLAAAPEAPAVPKPVTPEPGTLIAPREASIIALTATDSPVPAGITGVDAAPRGERTPAALAALPALDAPVVVQTAAQPVPPPAANAVQVQAEPAARASEIVLATRPERLATDVGIEVVRQIGAHRSEFSIRLDPPDLGRIDVRIEFHRGEVRAVVTTDNPQTHDLLRRDADGLARMLEMSGFRADSSAFRFDLRQDGGQSRSFAQAEQAKSSDAGAEATAELVPGTARSTRRGLLDLFA